MRSHALNGGLELLRKACDIARLGLAGLLVTVGIAGRDEISRHQHIFKQHAPHNVARNGQAAHRATMVALASSDETAACVLAVVQVELQRHLQGAVH